MEMYKLHKSVIYGRAADFNCIRLVQVFLIECLLVYNSIVELTCFLNSKYAFLFPKNTLKRVCNKEKKNFWQDAVHWAKWKILKRERMGNISYSRHRRRHCCDGRWKERVLRAKTRQKKVEKQAENQRGRLAQVKTLQCALGLVQR